MALNSEDQRLKSRVLNQLDAQARESILQEEYAREEPVRTSEILKEKQLRSKALQPQRVPEVFDGLPEGLAPIFRNDFDSEALKEQEPWLTDEAWFNHQNTWGKNYASMYEQAYYGTQGYVSMEFLMSLDPEDLEMVRSMGDMGLDPQAWGAIETAATEVAYRRELETAAEARYQADVERRIQANDRQAEFIRNLPGIGAAAGDITQLLTGVNSFEEWESLSDEQKRELAISQVQQRYMEETEPPTPEALGEQHKGLTDRWLDGVKWIFKPQTEGLKQIGGWISDAINDDALLNLGPNTFDRVAAEQWGEDWQAEEWERKKEEIAALYRTDDQLIAASRTASFMSGEELWDDPETMEQLIPGARMNYMSMVGGVEELAKRLFAGAFADAQTDEQQLQLGQEIRDMHLATIEEEDYQLTDRVLNTLALLDKYGASTLSSGALLLMSDEDARSDFFTGRLGEFYDEIAKADNRPSNVMGLENTWAGLLLDVGGSVMMDPFNVMFMPKGAAAAGRAASKSAVQNTVKSGGVKLIKEEVIKAVVEGNRAALHNWAGFIMEANPQYWDELDLFIRRAEKMVDEDVLGPGLTKEVSNELKIIANEVPVTNKEGGVAALLSDRVAQLADSTNTPIHLNVPGPYAGGTPAKITDDAGKEWTAFWAEDGGVEAIVWKAEDGAIGGGMYWSTEAGEGGLIKMGFDGPGLSKETIDVLRDASNIGETGNRRAADAIIALSKDPSMTEEGARTVKGLSQYLIDNAGGRGQAVRNQIDMKRVDDIFERAMLEGADPGAQTRVIMNTAMGKMLSDDLRDPQKGISGIVARNLRPTRIVSTWVAHGPKAYREALDNMYYIWGSNVDKANEWVGRLIDARRTSVDQLDNMLGDELFHRAEAMGEQIAKLDDELVQLADWRRNPDVDSALQETELLATKSRLEQQLLEAEAQLRKQYPNAQGPDMGAIMNEMFEDFNREVIAKQKGWAKHVGEDGLVPWELLRPGGLGSKPDLTVRFTDELVDALGDTQDAKVLNAVLDDVAGPEAGRIFTTPVSPLDLVAAGSASGARYINFVAARGRAGIRSGIQSAHRLWTLDKVARISTAAVVSADELLRVFHRYGFEAVQQYIQDRALYTAARASSVLNAGRVNRYSGMGWLPEKMQQRLQKILDIPDRVTSAEKLTWGRAGGSMDVIEPGDPLYLNAARDWYRGFTSNEAFQMSLQSADDFKRWWYSPAGKTERLKVVQVGEDVRPAEWEEVYEGLQNIQEALLAGVPRDKRGLVLDSMKAAIEDMRAGGQGYMNPDAFNYTPSVRGFKKPGMRDNGMQGIMSGALNSMMEHFFMDPTNYRRGLLFNMAKEKELDRLLTLHADNGKEVLSNAQIMERLGFPPGSSVAQLPPDLLDAVAQRSGLIPRRHLEQMAEARAMDELDNVFYAWDMGSRGGNIARGAFPFGGPWADMWAFWGREMFTAPVLRGDLGTNKFLQTLQKGADKLPFDPRTAETISRFANTDFDITEGFAGEGGPDVDTSPLFFFPTQGNNAFSVLLPGLGVVPSVALDWLMEHIKDPVEDPQGYQQLLDQIAQIIPSVQYTTGDWRSDLTGGGQISAGAKMLIGGAMQFENVWATPAFLGDYSTEIDMNRAISATMAEEIREWLQAPNIEALRLNVIEAVNEAKDKAGQQLAGQLAIRNLVPANVDWDQSAEQLQSVWVDVAEAAGIEVRSEFSNLTREELERDPQKLRQYANDIRSAFFKMDRFERDMMVVEYPQLAVNLVSNWEWSDKGKRDLSTEAATLYDIGGSQEDLDRHQTYVQQGWVRPISPVAKAYRILGTVMSARNNLVSGLYSQTAEVVNDTLWEAMVSPGEKAVLTSFLESYGDKYGMAPGDEKRLWERWGSYGSQFGIQLATDLELDPESEEFKEAFTGLKPEEDAWSTSWPGVTGTSEQYGDFPVGILTMDDQFQKGMSLIGAEWDETFTGAQFHQALVDHISYGSMVDAEVMEPYMEMINDFAAGPNAATSGMNRVFYTSNQSPETKQLYEEFKIADIETRRRMNERGYVLRGDLDDIRTKFRNLMVLSEEDDAMKKWWSMKYEDTYGVLDWAEPIPPQLFNDEGELNSYASTPTIVKIQDGDTLLVKNTEAVGWWERQTEDLKSVRLLGVRARDFGLDDPGALEDRQTLMDVLVEAQQNGDTIYLVRDPDQFGSNTDKYGRELAWLYIGEEPWYFNDAFLPTD